MGVMRQLEAERPNFRMARDTIGIAIEEDWG